MKRISRRTLAIFIISSALCVGLLAWRSSMGWKRFEGPDIRGSLIMGDDSASPTKWWNHLWLALWGWKTVVVFQVPREAIERGYRVGYRPFDGKTMLEETINYDRQFRMKVGREDCVFFAVMKNGLEATLTLVARADVSDVRYQSAPLH